MSGNFTEITQAIVEMNGNNGNIELDLIYNKNVLILSNTNNKD